MNDLHSAAAELSEASEAYLTAEAAEREARMRATEARNRLNDAQKAFDAAVTKLRDSSPAGSDWKRGSSVEAVAPRSVGGRAIGIA
jgi:hypothetical protein